MEKFNSEVPPPHKAEERKNPETEGNITRRKFLKVLGIGAGLAAAESLIESGKAAAVERGPSTGVQVVDGQAFLLSFDAKGKVEHQEMIGSTSDLGLSKKDTDVIFSSEVVHAAKEFLDTGRRCRQGNVDACRSVGLARADLVEAIRSRK